MWEAILTPYTVIGLLLAAMAICYDRGEKGFAIAWLVVALFVIVKYGLWA